MTPKKTAGGRATKRAPAANGMCSLFGVDPRPDFKKDSRRWADLLGAAWLDGEDSDCWQALFSLRLHGAALQVSRGRARIVLGDAVLEFAASREQYLVPSAEECQGLLRDLASAQPGPASAT